MRGVGARDSVLARWAVPIPIVASMATIAALWSAGAGTILPGLLGACVGILVAPSVLSYLSASQRERGDELRSGARWFMVQLALFIGVMLVAAVVAIALGIPSSDEAVLGDPREMLAL